MVGDPGGLKRTLNEYLERRLRPMHEQIDQTRLAIDRMAEDNRRELSELRARTDELRTLSEALLGTVNLTARRERSATPIRVLFLIHYMEAWDGLAEVYQLMRDADDFQPIVASIPRRLPASAGFRDEALTHERLTALGVPHLRFDGDDSYLTLESIKQLDPHLIFRQSQWDADVPPAFSTPNLSFARLALIPYEVFNPIENVELHGPVRDTATDSRYHRNCWAVFCDNEYVRERARRMSPATDAAQWVVTGHPKWARLRAAIDEAADSQGRPFTVMWSAHHSIGEDWTRFGLFPTSAPEMIAWARSRPDVHFVFSPHPSLLTVMEAALPPLTPEMVADFWEQWNSLPNTEFDPGGNSGTYGALFGRADVCVSDGISMLVEFQVANRPVIHVAREGHRPFNDLGQICQRGWHTVSSTSEARELVERFEAGEPDPLADWQRKNTTEVFGDDGAAARIVDHIRANWHSH